MTKVVDFVECGFCQVRYDEYPNEVSKKTHKCPNCNNFSLFHYSEYIHDKIYTGKSESTTE